MQQSEFNASLRSLVDNYVAALDARRFDDWLALYAEGGYYAVIRRAEHEANNNVVLVGEDMKRLRGRISSGTQRDKRRMVHMVGWIRGDQAAATATAGFALWLDGTPAYAGQYELSLANGDGRLRIKRCTVVLDNPMIREPIYLPI